MTYLFYFYGLAPDTPTIPPTEEEEIVMADVVKKAKSGSDTNNLGAVTSLTGRLNYRIIEKDDDPDLTAIEARNSGHFKPPYIV